MASTAAVVYVRPTIRGPRGSKGVVFVTHRQVAGIYTASLFARNVNKHKKPSSLHPIGYIGGDRSKPVLIDEAWSRHIGLEINGRKLGGTAYPTVPELTEFILLAQNNASQISQILAAMEQMNNANAQSIQGLRDVVNAAALAGAAQVPPPVLARQETTPPLPFVPPDNGSAGGD